MRIGIFDSGIGGEAIAAGLRLEFPDARLDIVNDRKHLPYGDKSISEIRSLTNAAIQPILESDIIIIACNSATAAAITWLRKKYPSRMFIGIEPMIKPARAQTKTKVIAVFATPATLQSDAYNSLKKRVASDITIIEPDCSSWAKMIEDNEINHKVISETIQRCLAQSADIIVLGCTHYHWIKDEIIELSTGRAAVLEPSASIGHRVRQLLNL